MKKEKKFYSHKVGFLVGLIAASAMCGESVMHGRKDNSDVYEMHIRCNQGVIRVPLDLAESQIIEHGIRGNQGNKTSGHANDSDYIGYVIKSGIAVRPRESSDYVLKIAFMINKDLYPLDRYAVDSCDDKFKATFRKIIASKFVYLDDKEKSADK